MILLLGVLLIACNDDDKPAVDPVVQVLVESLANELTPLPVDPLQWTDEQLQFLDEVSDQDIVGLGEATHGTSEFFRAKHRILRYLAEKHGFKIFAIEADFGESLFLNEAVLKSDKGEIENLMKNKMHFWTWKTTEVRDMLYWMCDYNNGKSNAEKIQYWGIDCQFNTFHPDMVLSQLSTANIPFIAFAQDVLTEAKTAAANRFGSYSQSSFDAYLRRVDALTDSIDKYEEVITAKSSKRQYELTLRLTLVTRQTAEVMYYGQKQNVAINYRDKYMADNAAWLLHYSPGQKIALWAHNYHVSAIYQSMGQNLKTLIPGKYTTIGFLFSAGQFTASNPKGRPISGHKHSDAGR
ncbi:MAG: erythromycin esterase family protein [Chryseolinea sp.]